MNHKLIKNHKGSSLLSPAHGRAGAGTTSGRQLKIKVRIFVKKSSDFVQKVPLSRQQVQISRLLLRLKNGEKCYNFPMFKQIINLFYELGVLKFLKRSGWVVIGSKDGESVADHSLCTAQISYILAKLERYSKVEEPVTALVFHEIGETRSGKK